MAAAVPFAIKAGTMIGGSLLGKKLSGPSKEQKTAMAGQQQAGTQLNAAAGPLMGQGQALTQQGGGYLGNAANYYNTILGSRSAARESLAPETATALDYYKGASNKIGRTMRGGSRDYAQAELERQKVGQIAGMLPAARANAAQGIGGLGGTALSAGSSLTGQAGNLYSNAGYINSGMFNNATTLRNQEGEGGRAWGNILYDAAQMIPWGKGGGGSKGIYPGIVTNTGSFI